MKLKVYIFSVIDLITFPLTFVSALWLKFNRRFITGFWASKGPISKQLFRIVGVFPIMRNFYEPFFYTGGNLAKSLSEKRLIPGIRWNVQNQLLLLKEFRFSSEIGSDDHCSLGFQFDNGSFMSGDAEILYNMIRYFKPKRVIEIGCGNSTYLIGEALLRNRMVDSEQNFKHTCIEPYYNYHLANLEVEFLKTKVENLDLDFFKSLESNDILFIDSSHIVRPQGDVLFEILQILPHLNPGVIIHFHDVFSPRDILEEWLMDGVVFWNEQYFLEAFLTMNNYFEIVCAVNFLKNNYYEELIPVAINLTPSREPGSFWIRRNNIVWVEDNF